MTWYRTDPERRIFSSSSPSPLPSPQLLPIPYFTTSAPSRLHLVHNDRRRRPCCSAVLCPFRPWPGSSSIAVVSLLSGYCLGASSTIPTTTGASDLRRESTRVLDHHSTRTSDEPPPLPPAQARPTNPQTISPHGQDYTEPPTLWPNVTPRDEDSSVLSLQDLQGHLRPKAWAFRE
jgi:hypothetical protein